MTTNRNGAHESAPPLDIAYKELPSVTELEMSSGITVWVRPASLNDQRLIRDKVNERYPLPKEADFKILVPEDQASIPGQTMTDVDRYKEALGEIAIKQQEYWIRLHTLACLDFPESTDTIVERYLPEIQRKRKALELPADDLEAVIFHAVVRTKNDENLIVQVITQQLPVEMSEVISQLRIFRPATERSVDHPVPQRRKAAPRTGMDQGEIDPAANKPAV